MPLGRIPLILVIAALSLTGCKTGTEGAVVDSLAPGSAVPFQAKLSGIRAHALTDTLLSLYPVPHVPGVQFGADLSLDLVSCTWSGLPSAAPTCSVTLEGKVYKAAPTVAADADSTVYQILAELGAGTVTQAPASQVTLTSLSCMEAFHSGPDYACDYNTPTGTAIANGSASTILSFQAGSALPILNSFSAAGVPPSSGTTASQISCTATPDFYFDEAVIACTLTVSGTSYNLSAGTKANALYQVLAQSGVANYDVTNANYVATATAVSCTSATTPSCSLTVQGQHPVISWNPLEDAPGPRYLFPLPPN